MFSKRNFRKLTRRGIICPKIGEITVQNSNENRKKACSNVFREKIKILK